MARLSDWMRMEPQMMAKKRLDGDGTPDKTEKRKLMLDGWLVCGLKMDRDGMGTGWGYH